MISEWMHISLSMMPSGKQRICRPVFMLFPPQCHSTHLFQRHKDAYYILSLGPVGVMHDKGILSLQWNRHYWGTQWTQQSSDLQKFKNCWVQCRIGQNRVINQGDRQAHAKCSFIAESWQWVFVIEKKAVSLCKAEINWSMVQWFPTFGWKKQISQEHTYWLTF